MRRIFTFVVALVAFVVASCEPTNTPETQPDPTFTIITDEIVDIEASGGSVMVRYTIENPVDSEEIKSQMLNTEMITAVDCSVANVVKIDVAPNPTTQQREGTVILSYADHSRNITIRQQASAYEMVNIAANQLIGTYYGERVVEGLGNYWIILSKDGVVDGDVQPNTEHIRLDILAPLPADEENVKLPDGTYHFDTSNTFGEFSILNLPNSDYMYVDENLEGWSSPLVDATMIVAGNHIEVVAYTEDKQFNITFDGDYALEAYEISDCISNLAEDVEIDVSGCNVEFGGHGDYWRCGYYNWVVEFIDKAGFMKGLYLCLDLLGTTADDSSGFVGVYPSAGFSKDDPGKPNFGPGVFVPGVRISDDGLYMQGSLYMVYNSSGNAVTQAPLHTGTIEIKANTDGTHTIIVDAYDDAPKPNKLTLNWTGRLQ